MTNEPKLRWEKHPKSPYWTARLGHIHIGYVCIRHDGTIGYTVTGIHVKWITKGYGDVKSVSSGKRAVERAWRAWAEKAGLVGV